MSEQDPQRQSLDGIARPLLQTSDSRQLKSPSRPPVPSIEVPENGGLASRSSFALTPQSPLQPRFRVPESPRAAVGESQQAKQAKIAIPRLKRAMDTPTEGSARSGGRHRVNHACEPCRHRKTKCSGERPICRHCQDFKIACFYADGKRDRVKKQFGSMAEKVADYEKILRDLATRVGEADARIIRASLEKDAFADTDEVSTQADTTPTLEIDGEDEESGAESEVSAGVGSTGALDRTDEDFTREEAKLTGFVGKNSEVTWMQRLRQRTVAVRQPRTDRIATTEGFAPDVSAQDVNYHLDDLNISTFEAVDPYELPTVDTAHRLFTAYMTRVHPTFPIVGKVLLSGQFQKLMTGQIQRPPDKWLAILNIIFAIGAKYSHMIQADWKGDERDHLIYFTRARLLSVSGDSLFQHPDLQHIQILGLMAMYFLCTSQVNRSWTLVGYAIRGATALGMNMRNDSKDLQNSLKEIRYRVWWALYTLEHRLCSMTGRVNCILDEHCTTPLPVPVDEEKFDTEEGIQLLSSERQSGDRQPASNTQTPSATSLTPSTDGSRSVSKPDSSRSPSQQVPNELAWAKNVTPNSSLYFLHLVQLTRLTQSMFHRLYNPASINGSWSDIQDKIKDLDGQLEAWYRKLPAIFDFRRKQRDREFYEFRLSLGFVYYGTKITIHRPCLCRLDRKVPGQSNRSLEFNRNAAAACVEAAQDMLRLIPDEPNAVGLIRVGPWWSILHWLVQASTVLMLEISFRAHHMPQEADSLLEASKKAVRWQHSLGEENLSARRAWSLCNSMLHEAAKKIGREVKDLPERPPGRMSLSTQDDSSAMSAYTATHAMSSDGYTPAGAIHNNPILYSSSSTLPNFLDYTGVDQLMHYDQYFPTQQGMGGMHQFSAGQGGVGDGHNDGAGRRGMADGDGPSTAEMDFMSDAYHEANQQQQQQHHHHHQQGGGRGGQGQEYGRM